MNVYEQENYFLNEGYNIPRVASCLLLQQKSFLLTGELQVQLKGVAVQVMDVLLNIAAGSQWDDLRWAGWDHLQAAELTEEIFILWDSNKTANQYTVTRPSEPTLMSSQFVPLTDFCTKT